MTVRHGEIGTNVGHVHIIALFEQPECEGAFLVDDKCNRVGKNTVLENDGVTH